MSAFHYVTSLYFSAAMQRPSRHQKWESCVVRDYSGLYCHLQL